MKVKLLLIAALAAVSMTAFAEDVPNTSAEDSIYVKDLQMKVGEQVTVNVYFANKSPYAAAQGDFYLPDGLTAVEYKTGKWFKKTTDERYTFEADEEDPHTLSQSNPLPNTWRFVLMHMSNAKWGSGDSPMLTVGIKAEKEGTYECSWTKVHWSTGIVGGIGDGDGPDTKFVVTVTSTGIQDVTSANVVKAQKVIENGQIYIIAGDKKYNVMGAEVK